MKYKRILKAIEKDEKHLMESSSENEQYFIGRIDGLKLALYFLTNENENSI